MPSSPLSTAAALSALRWPTLSLMFSAVLALSACGGGGSSSATGGGGTPPPPPPPPPSAASLAQQCGSANPYLADASRPTTAGSLTTEKAWIQAYLNESYLWYADVPQLSTTSGYSDTSQYLDSLSGFFDASLSPLTTASGKRKDQFSFTYPTKAWNDLSQSGVSAGYGIDWTLASPTPPRGIRVAFVEPNSPAALQGVQRGDTLVSVDGVGANDSTASGVDTLNEGMFPSTTGGLHRFVFTPVAGGTRSVSLTSSYVTKTPVPVTSVLTTSAGRKVGYLLFNDHIASAEAQLITAVNTLRAAAVQDLVLDLRYNGGGYLYIASELAYMVAGASRTSGQVFEQLRYNNKRTAETNGADARTPFYDTSCYMDANYNCTRQEALPSLNLSRVYVLTSPSTCSASEAIINGLRGVNVEVVAVGGTTCGKPYGFTAKDNCGVSYFPIEFQGTNAKGFGDYADGFSATCAGSDDYSKSLGDASERQLAAALFHVDNSRCDPSAAGRVAPQSASAAGAGRLLRGPERENRILVKFSRR